MLNLFWKVARCKTKKWVDRDDFQRNVIIIHLNTIDLSSLGLYRQTFNKEIKTIMTLWCVTAHLHLQLILKQN